MDYSYGSGLLRLVSRLGGAVRGRHQRHRRLCSQRPRRPRRLPVRQALYADAGDRCGQTRRLAQDPAAHRLLQRGQQDLRQARRDRQGRNRHGQQRLGPRRGRAARRQLLHAPGQAQHQRHDRDTRRIRRVLPDQAAQGRLLLDLCPVRQAGRCIDARRPGGRPGNGRDRPHGIRRGNTDPGPQHRPRRCDSPQHPARVNRGRGGDPRRDGTVRRGREIAAGRVQEAHGPAQLRHPPGRVWGRQRYRR